MPELAEVVRAPLTAVRKELAAAGWAEFDRQRMLEATGRLDREFRQQLYADSFRSHTPFIPAWRTS